MGALCSKAETSSSSEGSRVIYSTLPLKIQLCYIFGYWFRQDYGKHVDILDLPRKYNTLISAEISQLISEYAKSTTMKFREHGTIHKPITSVSSKDHLDLYVATEDDLIVHINAVLLIKAGEWSSESTKIRSMDHLRYGSERGLLVTGSADSKIHVWNGDTHKLLHQFRGGGSDIACVRFTPDGTAVVCGSKGNVMFVCSLITASNSGKRGMRNPPVTKVVSIGHDGWIRGITLLGDSVISGSKLINQWRLDSKHSPLTLYEPSSSEITIMQLEFNCDRSYLIARCSSQLLVFKWPEMKKTKRIRQSSAKLTAFMCHPCNPRLIAVSFNSPLKTMVHLMDVEDGSILSEMDYHSGIVIGLFFNGDDKSLICVSKDNSAALLDVC